DTQVSALSPTQVAAIDPAAVSSLSTTAVAALEPTQVAALSDTQVAQLTATQADAFDATQVGAIATEAVASLSTDFVASLDLVQVNGLNTEQVAQLTFDQLNSLASPDFIDGLVSRNLRTQLEAIGNTTGSDQAPQVTAVGSSGEYVVTWFGIDSAGDNSIFVQKFAADGTLSGSAVQLEAIGKTNGGDFNPQVTAVGSSGEYVVAWYGVDSAGDNSIFVQKFAADGTLSGSAVQLEAIGNTTGSDLGPQVTAVGSSGEYVVTWHGQDSASDNSIFVQKFAADGTLSGSAVQLEAIGKTTGSDQYPQVTAVGSSGEYVVTWHGQDSAGDYSIFVQKFAADGTLSGSAVQLEAIGKTNGADLGPQVTAVGSSGEYVVTWYGEDSAGDNSIFVQKFAADGTLSGSAVQLEAIGKTNGA
ncbi:hypothetical protein, partial [Azonexus fungiphilus]|uniref:hypothetical protein n=1 Tax=Azonexus fungiphilus TaxID=146940 RepID=UPI001474AE6D